MCWRYVSLKKPGHKWRRRRGESDLNFKCRAFFFVWFSFMEWKWHHSLNHARKTMKKKEKLHLFTKLIFEFMFQLFFPRCWCRLRSSPSHFLRSRSRSGNNRSIFGRVIRGCKWCMGTWDIWVDVFSLSVRDAIRCVFKIHRGGISKLMPFV